MTMTELIIVAAGLFIGYFIVSNLLSRDKPEEPAKLEPAKDTQAMPSAPADTDNADSRKSP